MVKDHNGKEYKNIAEMCAAYSINKNTYLSRKAQGMSTKDALTIPTKHNSYVDHLGNVFSSVEKMCKYHGVSHITYNKRINEGMSLEDALNHSLNVKLYKDHFGNTFSTIREMCEYHGIDQNTYKTRIKTGMSVEEALTEKTKSPSDKGTKCVDAYGKQYRSYSEMARAYGISSSVLRDRVKRGLSINDILVKREVIDHKGNAYKSETQMCKEYGISITTYKERLKKGYSIEEALTNHIKKAYESSGKKCKDHLGKIYNSMSEMCRAYEIDMGTFKHRIEVGMSIEDALLTKNEIFDHHGNCYRSELEMCRAYHIDNSTFRYRIKEGFSIEEALTIPRHYTLGEYRVSRVLNGFCETGKISSYLHNVQLKKLFEILGKPEQYNAFMCDYEKELNINNIYISRRRLAKFRFDFSLIKNGEIFAFVEYDGIQHFKFIDLFFKTIEDFFMSHTRDEAKDIFSETNRIPLLRIRYDQIDEDLVRTMILDLVVNPYKYTIQHNTYLSNEEYMAVFEDKNVQLGIAPNPT